MFERFLILARTFIPFDIKCKENSKLMRFLGFFVRIFNKKFAKYGTTIGSTIYLPKALLTNPDEHYNVISLVAHEVVHIRDEKRLTAVLYRFLYLFPQILAPLCLLSLLAIWFSNWWLLCLLALGLLCPIPAPVRVYIEKRGYLMTLAIAQWLEKTGFEVTIDFILPHVIKQFTGNGYYFMGAGSGKMLTRWFKDKLVGIQYDQYPDDFFKAVHDFIKKEEQDA